MKRGDQITAGSERLLVLDQGPDGWWVYVEDKVDERGYPLVEQRSVADLKTTDEPGLF